jgi:hypothetical protein
VPYYVCLPASMLSRSPFSEMPFAADIEAFVQAAVRLPHERLRRIDRQWDSLSAERRVISELVQANNERRLQMSQLRDYIAVAARMAGAMGEAESGPTSLLLEDVTEAIFPAARALLLRDILETSTTPGRAAAFAALTAPFLDILPGRK